ncbi:hypothetical protein AB5N19_11103 [Seiridium cardinale]|uniref:rRNA-processing protein FYV7 n=1 Tax=Seiridium cardinale TaxID=138064 RepID=A0ABR2XIM1_9PEZI
MAPKRPLDSEDASHSTGDHAAKKPRKGFRVGPDNLPDGPWRRKVTKIKQDLIQKAKLKKAYKKIKARELQENDSSNTKNGAGEHDAGEPDGEEQPGAEPASEAAIHPERQAMLDGEEPEPEAPDAAQDGRNVRERKPRNHDRPDKSRHRSRNTPHKPGYYDKALTEASKKKTEQEAREAEFQRRREERDRKNAERERFGRAMRKARTPGRDGQRKLGRESGLLLEKVRRMTQPQ